MARKRNIRGFYGVIDGNDEALVRALVKAATVIQVRMKHASLPGVAQAARMARRLCVPAGVLLIVNDHIDIALEVGADGVHLGQADATIEEARRRARGQENFLVGISTHNIKQVEAAVAGGANYIAFGPVFGTQTKKNPDPTTGLENLKNAVAAAGNVPVVAIGGITAETSGQVRATGAQAACSIGAVNQAVDPYVVARAIARAWE
jgi:thiamine-phosphate pyrophosphorylase